MKLGLFMMPTHPPTKSTEQCYDEDRDLILLAEELGFTEAWIGEHATMQWENIPSPDQFIAYLAPQTRRIRLGTGVVLMAHHHPVNTANRIAQLDHLLRGRLNFGIGVGGASTDVEMFGIDAPSGLPGIMLMRAIDVILKLWRDDPPYDLPGQFWPIRLREPRPEAGLGWTLRPYQKPHPPIALPGVGAQSRLLYTAGQRGWWPLTSNFTHTRHLGTQWEQVSRGAASAGRAADRGTWRIGREIYVDETNAAAREFAREGSLGRTFTDYWIPLLHNNPTLDLMKSNDAMGTGDVTVDYLIENHWLVGDPDEVARRIRAIDRASGGFGTLLMITLDWDDPARWQRSMRLLATEVMPRVADLGAA